MDKKTVIQQLKDTCPHMTVLSDEPMKLHTSFKIGGNADVFVSVKNEDEVIRTLEVFKSLDIKYTVIGNGSNLLVSDEGIDGAVLCLGKEFSSVECEGNIIRASAGTLLSKIASVALENSLTGFEFASGIPGSLGGALVMNAGAYGGEMKDVVLSTRYIDKNGKICECEGDAHGFGYRRSRFTGDDVILSSAIELKHGNRDEIRTLMRELAEKRRDKQPVEFPSAGSAFKRPEGYFAAKLIDDAGLRGYRVGDAMVSEKHCGFIINAGEATFADVMAVIDHCREVVFEKEGVTLEPEVRILKRN